MPGHIIIKTQDEIEALRQSGRILASICQQIKRSLKSGMTTKQIDEEVEALIRDRGVKPAFKGYRGYPACICTSVNQEVVHGIPSKRQLREGDILSIDIGIIARGYYSDMAFTVGIGHIKPRLQELIDITSESLHRGISQAKSGHHLFDISAAIQKFVESHHLSIVKDFVGHGIGTSLHEDPEIPNFGEPHTGPLLTEGMVFAIEPMVNLGVWQTKILDDGWTVVTADGEPSAHFEHTVAIAKNGPEILTE